MSAPLPVGSLCFHCGYDLRGLRQNICPECGNSFDPQNPITYVHPAFGWRTKRLQRALAPPPLFDCFAVAGAAAFVLVNSSSPGWPHISASSLIWIPFLVLLGLMPIVNFLARRLALRKVANLGMHFPTFAGRRWSLMLASSVLLLATLLCPWPFWIRFAVSYPALQRTVAIEQPPNQPQWVGSFYVRNIRSYPSGVVFFVIEGDYDLEYGLTFAKHGDPPGRPYWRNRRLWGNWFCTARP